MRITQAEWSAIKVAVGIAEEKAVSLTKAERTWLASAISAVETAEERLEADNAKMARHMKEVRKGATA